MFEELFFSNDGLGLLLIILAYLANEIERQRLDNFWEPFIFVFFLFFWIIYFLIFFLLKFQLRQEFWLFHSGFNLLGDKHVEPMGLSVVVGEELPFEGVEVGVVLRTK